MKRSRFLKYVSILMMLISLVRFFFGLMMTNLFTTASTLGRADKQTVQTAFLAFAVIILCAVAELVCGFLGALNWEEPLRARRCVIWGILTLVLGLAGNVIQSFTGYGVSFVAWTTGAVAPALYLAAALRFYLRAGKRRR